MKARLRRLGRVSKIINLQPPKERGSKIWLAGRGSACPIYTKSFYASRQHFFITYRDDKFFISDLQSANGTFLNDEKLVSEKLLTPGSIISIGVPSQMQDSPDCVVYVFELCPDGEDEQQSDTELGSDSQNDREAPELENDNADMEPRPGPSNEPNVDDVEMTAATASTSSAVFVEASGEPAMATGEPKPAKRRRLEESSTGVEVRQEEQEDEKTETNALPREETVEIRDENDAKPAEEEDVSAYEASTQEIKTEPEFSNYSQAEELIELSDSEEVFVPEIKQEKSKTPEQGDEGDDDVVVLKMIIRTPCDVEAPPFPCKVEDNLTETDKVWMGRLLKIKEEPDSAAGNDDSTGGELSPEIVVKEEVKIEVNESSADPGDPAEELQRLSVQDHVAEPEAPPAAAAPAQGARPKRSVTFNTVPEVRYFEAARGPRWSASDRGRARFQKLIFNVCSWNAHWLEECKTVSPDKDPAKICEEELRKVPNKFLSHTEYMTTYVPGMLLQLWYKVRDKWLTSEDSMFRHTVSVDHCGDFDSNLSLLNCTGVIRCVEGHKQMVREGHLVTLRVHQLLVPPCITPACDEHFGIPSYLVFGVVENRTYEPYRNQPLHPAMAESSAAIREQLHVVRYKILVKKRPAFQMDCQKLVQLTVIHQLSQDLGLFRGICFLPDSPLCPLILKPNKIGPPSQQLPDYDLAFREPLDVVQSDIVRKLSHVCYSTDSAVRCVMGAAGTGKGQVIAALVHQLLFGDEWRRARPKIIYCTQWNVPLDEMTQRLRTCMRTAEEPVSLARVGLIREVKPEVRDLCVSNLASMRPRSSKRSPDGREIEPEVQVIVDADVLCTTCSSPAISEIYTAFEKVSLKDKGRKVVCIIDEAMSCREASSVLPLVLGVTHLILVGDISQMQPSYSGERTHSLGLDLSLFHRIYKNFVNVSDKKVWPIFLLRTQYRMCSGLSKLMGPPLYCLRLQRPIVRVADAVPNLRTHVFFVYRAPENVVRAQRENREVRIVSRIAKAVARTTGMVRTARTDRVTRSRFRNHARIAVITCELRQAENLLLLLPREEYPEMEIHKIQGLQGREFDVVIFAYSGRKVLTSWLVTALTRARSSLMVYASEQAIESNALLKKLAVSADSCGVLRYVNSEMPIGSFQAIMRAA